LGSAAENGLGLNCRVVIVYRGVANVAVCERYVASKSKMRRIGEYDDIKRVAMCDVTECDDVTQVRSLLTDCVWSKRCSAPHTASLTCGIDARAHNTRPGPASS